SPAPAGLRHRAAWRRAAGGRRRSGAAGSVADRCSWGLPEWCFAAIVSPKAAPGRAAGGDHRAGKRYSAPTLSGARAMPNDDRGPPRPATSDAAIARSPALRLGLGCGLLAPLLWAATIVIAGEWRPGFDHLQQYISELGERGSTTGAFMRYGGFVASGALHVGYAAAFHAAVAHMQVRRSLALVVALLIAADGLGRIGAGLFPCEPGCAAPQVLSQRLHSLSATVAFLSIAAAALLAARL